MESFLRPSQQCFGAKDRLFPADSPLFYIWGNLLIKFTSLYLFEYLLQKLLD
jgi:hypothetical protein